MRQSMISHRLLVHTPSACKPQIGLRLELKLNPGLPGVAGVAGSCAHRLPGPALVRSQAEKLDLGVEPRHSSVGCGRLY